MILLKPVFLIVILAVAMIGVIVPIAFAVTPTIDTSEIEHGLIKQILTCCTKKVQTVVQHLELQ